MSTRETEGAEACLPAITTADLGTLSRAAELERRFDAGIFPSDIGQLSHFAKLVRHGLLRFDGWGSDIDGEREGDVRLYRLTDVGKQALARVDKERP